MKIVCLGDSLTQGDYGIFGKRGIANVQEKNYPYFLSKILDAEVVNYGKCGYKASTYLKYYQEGNVDLTRAEIGIIMLGTNGGHDSEAMDADENMAYRELVSLCKKDAPEATIFLCTPPHVTENPEYSNCGYAEQVKQAVGFVRRFAKETGLPVIELADCPDFTKEYECIMQPNDGLHFGEVGYWTMAKFIAKEILQDQGGRK